MTTFSADEVARFARNGYAIVRNLAPAASVAHMRDVALAHLAECRLPVEYEADTRYPGAPASTDAPGGRTVRRLLQAYARDAVFRDVARLPVIGARLRQVLGGPAVLSQAHHNCIMTKNPAYSSLTNWHRDIRYWSFEKPELVSVWVALGDERIDNGCLLVLPGTHRMDFAAERLDDAQFLRQDLAANRAVLQTQVSVELQPGDVLFFHCRLFHAAGSNQTDQTKLSVVYTYHAPDNQPLPGTRSASMPEIALV